MTVGCEKTSALTQRGLFSRESESSSGLFRRPSATSTSDFWTRGVSAKTEKTGQRSDCRKGLARRPDTRKPRALSRSGFGVNFVGNEVALSDVGSPVATLVVLATVWTVSGTCLRQSRLQAQHIIAAVTHRRSHVRPVQRRGARLRVRRAEKQLRPVRIRRQVRRQVRRVGPGEPALLLIEQLERGAQMVCLSGQSGQLSLRTDQGPRLKHDPRQHDKEPHDHQQPAQAHPCRPTAYDGKPRTEVRTCRRARAGAATGPRMGEEAVADGMFRNHFVVLTAAPVVTTCYKQTPFHHARISRANPRQPL
jgi:hypothetical protein